MTNKERLEELKAKLIDVLTEIDQIMPVQFHDTDCDDCVFNFSGVRLDETDNRAYIELAMWHDNLPSHRDNPLRDSHGQIIPPGGSDSEYCQPADNVALVKFNGFDGKEVTDIVKHTTKGGLVSMLKQHNLPTIEVNEHEELSLYYERDGKGYYVSICNKTSDISEEWYCFEYSDEVIVQAVLDDVCYSMEYNDARLKAEDEGKQIYQFEYLRQIKGTSKVSDLLKKAEG